MTTSQDDRVPAGFSPHFRKSPLTDPWEPLFSKVAEASVTIALRVRCVHCNGMGFLHGGLISSLADNAMGLSVVESLKVQGMLLEVGPAFRQYWKGSWHVLPDASAAVAG
jgi:acyl-coenzyme A thioesterase PaaI-like protein